MSDMGGGGVVEWRIQGPFRKLKTLKSCSPISYEQPSTNEHFHLIQIYKVKISVQFRMAYHFQIAYVPENIQSIKKYQRGGHKRLSGSVRKNEYHFSRE